MGAQQRNDPSYVALAASGELKRRAAAATAALAKCRVCPRACGVDRLRGEAGACGIGRQARVASCFPHHGEEDCLRGWRGSGTIFFSGCNLLCVFCQNWEISHGREGRDVPPERLAELMLALQSAGCHNINWVTPTHVVPQALEALVIAVEHGLKLPIVYNSGGYDALEMLRLLDGVVDIYMPDFKLWDPDVAERLLKARDYPEVARRALQEMHRQVGMLQLDDDGLARRGVLVRHLVMPNGLAGTGEIARWLAETLSPDTYINVMAQYHPAGGVGGADEMGRLRDIARPITVGEFRAALAEARRGGLWRFDQRRLL
ncbi:MAG: radical SAM protein [Verrucomicrobiae bacterium]|nr:radical SAM protein [Verrucomicrobiae bacterium]